MVAFVVMKDDPTEEFPPLPTDTLTWAALLGRWVDFARSAVALPADTTGRKLRESVPDIIMLQAVWFALQHLDGLEHDEQALGLDRAAVLIDKHTERLNTLWTGEFPPQIRELINDANGQLLAAEQHDHDAHDGGTEFDR